MRLHLYQSSHRSIWTTGTWKFLSLPLSWPSSPSHCPTISFFIPPPSRLCHCLSLSMTRKTSLLRVSTCGLDPLSWVLRLTSGREINKSLNKRRHQEKSSQRKKRGGWRRPEKCIKEPSQNRRSSNRDSSRSSGISRKRTNL